MSRRTRRGSAPPTPTWEQNWAVMGGPPYYPVPQQSTRRTTRSRGHTVPNPARPASKPKHGFIRACGFLLLLLAAGVGARGVLTYIALKDPALASRGGADLAGWLAIGAVAAVVALFAWFRGRTRR